MPAAKIGTKSLLIDLCIISQVNTGVGVLFHVQVNGASSQSKFEVNHVMAEKLFNALKAIETLASGAMKVYGLRLGLYHSGGPGPGPRAVHKPS